MIASLENLSEIQAQVQKQKKWGSALLMKDQWHKGNKAKHPKPWTFRVALESDGGTLEGVFIEVYYQTSKIDGVNPTISFSLIVDSIRATGVDDNGPTSCHTNKVGLGLQYFRQSIGVPHIHFCVEDALMGYAEPLPQMTASELWITFLQKTNIVGAPKFELPPGQLELSL